MFKKIIVFLIILSLWFLSSVFFPFDAGFYNSLNLPAFTPPKILFSIIWPVIFILITITIYSIIKKDNQTSETNNTSRVEENNTSQSFTIEVKE